MTSRRRYTKKEFNLLQQEWDRKLADSGFEDIEHRLPNGAISGFTNKKPLKQMLARDQDVPGYGARGARAEYFSICSERALTACLSRLDPLLCMVWALHAEGLTGVATAQELGIPRMRVVDYLNQLKETIYDN